MYLEGVPTVVHPRMGRLSFLPGHFPEARAVAEALAVNILSNLTRYKLHGRCVIKVSTYEIHQTLRSMGYDIDHIHTRAIGGYLGAIFRQLDYVLLSHGFILIDRKDSRKTVKYYAMPGWLCPATEAKT